MRCVQASIYFGGLSVSLSVCLPIGALYDRLQELYVTDFREPGVLYLSNTTGVPQQTTAHNTLPYHIMPTPHALNSYQLRYTNQHIDLHTPQQWAMQGWKRHGRSRGRAGIVNMCYYMYLVHGYSIAKYKTFSIRVHCCCSN